MQRYLAVIIAVTCCVSFNSGMASEITRGSMLSNSCAACHGTDGKSPGAIPAINGKSSQYLFQTLQEFRDGRRPATVMGRHATGYTDEEMQQIADYFSGLP